MEEDTGGWAEARDSCPHVDESITIPDTADKIPDLSENITCSVSECNFKECWLCLCCHNIFCGRYGAGHMMKHYQQNTNHCLALGVGDLSYWCYKCDSYISHLKIKRVFKIYQMCHLRKFKEKVPKDLIRQYSDDIDDDIKNNDEYELYINMDIELNQIKSQLQQPNNSIMIIDELIATINNTHSSLNTYLYYNELTLLHKANKQIHECPDRIIKTVQLLSNINLLNKCTLIKGKHFINDITFDEKQNDAFIDSNLLKLDTKYKAITKTLQQKIIDEVQWFDSYTFLNKYSYVAAKVAYLSCYDLFNNVLNSKQYNYGFALVRPPGHHCNYSKPMGFCLNNNVGIGINALRENLKCNKDNKFMIIDWDIHHGNGTQDIFYSDSNVVYLSIHEGIRQFNTGTSYPSTGSINDIGDENNMESLGKNINIQLNVYSNYNEYGYGDNEYICVLNKLIIPILKEFNPDLVIISSGFDACIGDTMGKFRITPICYGLMVRLIINACKCNKVTMVLEGGYNLCTMPRAIACCIYSCLKGKINENVTLNEYEMEFLNSMDECEQNVFNEWKIFAKVNSKISEQHKENNMNEINKVVDKVTKIHGKYWKCFS
eukprot:238809_1